MIIIIHKDNDDKGHGDDEDDENSEDHEDNDGDYDKDCDYDDDEDDDDGDDDYGEDVEDFGDYEDVGNDEDDQDDEDNGCMTSKLFTNFFIEVNQLQQSLLLINKMIMLCFYDAIPYQYFPLSTRSCTQVVWITMWLRRPRL